MYPTSFHQWVENSQDIIVYEIFPHTQNLLGTVVRQTSYVKIACCRRKRFASCKEPSPLNMRCSVSFALFFLSEIQREKICMLNRKLWCKLQLETPKQLKKERCNRLRWSVIFAKSTWKHTHRTEGRKKKTFWLFSVILLVSFLSCHHFQSWGVCEKHVGMNSEMNRNTSKKYKCTSHRKSSSQSTQYNKLMYYLFYY